MRSLACVAAAACLLAGPLSAQPSLGLDLSYNSSYVSRGVSFTNQPVAQGSAVLSLPVAGLTLSGGAWGNLEAAQYAGSDHLSMTSGETGPNLTEVDVWAEASATAGSASVTAGVMRMTFPNKAGITSGSNTTDLYARVALPELPLAPRISVNYDVDKVQGAYVEAGVSQPLGPVTLGATAGWNAGQTERAGSGEEWIYADEGITHVETWVSASVAAGPLHLAPSAHVVLGYDDMTRVVAPGRGEDVKVWLGVAASWSRPLWRRP